MLKPLLTFALCLLAYCSLAQKTFVQDGKLNGIIPLNAEGAPSYQVVKEVSGATKADLFKRARKWFVSTYNSPKQVLQTNDPETGELTGKGIFTVSESIIGVSHVYPIRHLLSVDIKPGKYRITLTDFVVDDRGGSFPVSKVPTMGKKWIDKFYTKIDIEASTLLASLEKALSTSDDF